MDMTNEELIARAEKAERERDYLKGALEHDLLEKLTGLGNAKLVEEVTKLRARIKELEAEIKELKP